MTSAAWFQMNPGIASARTARHRALFLQRSETFLAAGQLIDGAKSRDPSNTESIVNLQIGLMMGKVTSGGLYAPSVLGVTTNAEAVGSTAIEATAAVVTEIGRRIGATGTFKLTGPPTANGIVETETVTYSGLSGTTITCTALTRAFVAGSFIQPTDGSETPRTFIPDIEAYGIPVVDRDGNSLSVVDFPKVPISGVVDCSMILPVWPSDTSLRQWIKSRMNDIGGGQFVFAGSGGDY